MQEIWRLYCGKYAWNGINKNKSIPLLGKQEWNGKRDSSMDQAWIGYINGYVKDQN